MTPPLHHYMGTFNLSNGKQQKVQLLKCFYMFIFTSAPQSFIENINIDVYISISRLQLHVTFKIKIKILNEKIALLNINILYLFVRQYLQELFFLNQKTTNARY